MSRNDYWDVVLQPALLDTMLAESHQKETREKLLDLLKIFAEMLPRNVSLFEVFCGGDISISIKEAFLLKQCAKISACQSITLREIITRVPVDAQPLLFCSRLSEDGSTSLNLHSPLVQFHRWLLKFCIALKETNGVCRSSVDWLAASLMASEATFEYGSVIIVELFEYFSTFELNVMDLLEHSKWISVDVASSEISAETLTAFKAFGSSFSQIYTSRFVEMVSQNWQHGSARIISLVRRQLFLMCAQSQEQCTAVISMLYASANSQSDARMKSVYDNVATVFRTSHAATQLQLPPSNDFDTLAWITGCEEIDIVSCIKLICDIGDPETAVDLLQFRSLWSINKFSNAISLYEQYLHARNLGRFGPFCLAEYQAAKWFLGELSDPSVLRRQISQLQTNVRFLEVHMTCVVKQHLQTKKPADHEDFLTPNAMMMRNILQYLRFGSDSSISANDFLGLMQALASMSDELFKPAIAILIESLPEAGVMSFQRLLLSCIVSSDAGFKLDLGGGEADKKLDISLRVPLASLWKIAAELAASFIVHFEVGTTQKIPWLLLAQKEKSTERDKERNTRQMSMRYFLRSLESCERLDIADPVQHYAIEQCRDISASLLKLYLAATFSAILGHSKQCSKFLTQALVNLSPIEVTEHMVRLWDESVLEEFLTRISSMNAGFLGLKRNIMTWKAVCATDDATKLLHSSIESLLLT